MASVPATDLPDALAASTDADPADDAAPAPRVGRYFVALTGLTVVAQLVALQLRDAIFGGTGWLTSVKFVGWGERLGFGTALALFASAAVGLWLLVWVHGIARLTRVSQARALRWAAVGWVLLSALDLIVRHELAAIFGDAFSIVEFSSGVGGFGAMLRNTWTWYSGKIISGVLAVAGCAVGAWAVQRWARRFSASWGVVDRFGLRQLHGTTLGALIGVVTFLTAFAHTWPDTREILVDDTMVGAPFGSFVVWVTDFDGDGYSQFENPADTAPFDAERHPWAIDVPGDGIDQDLLLGDLDPASLPPSRKRHVEALSTVQPFTAPAPIERSVMVVILESTRADALAREIDGKPVMPELRAAIEAGALVPPEAHATRGFTTTSLGNLFWGSFYHPGHTLFDDARDAGLEVAAFSGYDLAVEGVELSANLRRDEVIFDPRDDELPPRIDNSPARKVAGAIEDWLDARDADTPFLAYVHLSDPHFPYDQENPHVFADGPLPRASIDPDERDALSRAYHDQVHAIDAASGRILRALKASGHGDVTVIFVADHGESLFDDGLHLGHGIQIERVMTHSAMVVVDSPIDLPSVVSHTDLRGLIRQMWVAPELGRPPHIVDVPERSVLHYLGGTPAPSQIGEYTQEHGLVVYDFKRNQVRSGATGEFGKMERGAVPDWLWERGRIVIDSWAYLQVLNEGRDGWEVP